MSGSRVDGQTINEKGQFRLKGFHVLMIAITFFGSVITVDVTMAILAIKTFSGIEAEKPYERGLAFNRDIEAAKVQDARNWNVTQHVIREENGRAKFSVRFQDNMRMAIAGLDVSVHVKAPADAKQDLNVALNDLGAGLYEGMIEVKNGEWILELVAKDPTGIVYRSSNRISLN